jgi:hypothetical protein
MLDGKRYFMLYFQMRTQQPESRFSLQPNPNRCVACSRKGFTSFYSDKEG